MGERRFAPPVAVQPFEEPYDAVAFGPIGPQDIDPLPEAIPGTENLFYAPGVSASEDCLNLNVWSPVGAEKAPVLVYIHGGGFLRGSGTAPWLDGTAHARDCGLVVVTLNYRLGILGGLYLGDYESTRSDLGLQDQLLALRWVQANIAAFGGDPERVTVAGQSAGAMSVAALLFASSARGLFSRAVVESGHLGMTLSIEEARSVTRRVLAELHISADAPDVLMRLENTSLFRILAVQRQLSVVDYIFPLVDDGVVLDRVLESADMPDWSRSVDLLIGTTAEESRLFTIIGWSSEPESPELTLTRLLDDPSDRAAALSLYESEAERVDGVGISQRIVTEQAWTEPATRLALAHVSSAAHTYHYEFAWRSSALDGRVGAAHAVDVPFFFGNLAASGVDELLGGRVHEVATQSLARRTSAALAQFVSTGDLSGSPLGGWPSFKDNRRATMVIDVEPAIELDRSTSRLDFWRQHRSAFTASFDASNGGAA
jgi:para-nitrobenzyl esterase